MQTIPNSARSKQEAIATRPAAVILIKGKDKTLNLENIHERILAGGGMMASWTVEDDCAEDFLRDPMLNAYMANGIPVVVSFETKADADKVAKHLTAKVAQ
jgi:hypothetical protein